MLSERDGRVERARRQWEARLVDFSRNNRLLYFRDTKSSTLDLTQADEGAMRRLLGEKKVKIRELFAGEEAESAANRALAAHKKRVENDEEKGVATLNLALGFARWPVADKGSEPSAPVLLLPLLSEAAPRGHRDLELRRSEGEIALNGVLLLFLEREYGVKLDPDAIVDPDADELDVKAVLDRFYEAVAPRVPGFRIVTRSVVGNFHFPKMAMINDLKDQTAIAGHDLVAAIAGDPVAQSMFVRDRSEIDLRQLDQRPPGEDRAILVADSSQQRAVVSATSGQSGVVQGPPGCGKSQTIVNLIASLIANGQRVLFVAEKRAALDVVQRRLAKAGLDGLLLDLHGGDLGKRAIATKLRNALEAARSQPPIDHRSIEAKLAETRSELIAHLGRLHAKHPPAQRSLFDLIGEDLALARAGIEVRTRWGASVLSRLHPALATECRSGLVALANEKDLFQGTEGGRWLTVPLDKPEDLERALDVVSRGGRALDALGRAIEKLGARSASNVAGVRALLDLLRRVKAVESRFQSAIFDRDIDRLALSLRPASLGLWSRLWAYLTDGAYRSALTDTRMLAKSALSTAADAWRAVQEVRELAEQWGRHIAGRPALPANAPEVERALTEAEAMLVAGTTMTGETEVPSLREAIEALAATRTLAQRVHVVRQLERRLEAHGIDALIDELKSGTLPASSWARGFDRAYVASSIEHALRSEPGLASFQGRSHDRMVEEFIDLDRRMTELSAARLRRDHAVALIEAMNAHVEEATVVNREANKKSRHLPLRALAEQALHVLPALFPCWMASPLAVSQLIPFKPGMFDVVVFDEASQILPEDAVAALFRGKRAVVAGDRHQLPPTAFFAENRDDDSDEGDAGTSGFESLLDVMSSFLGTWTLDWHYRSRDERLIAFSNRQVYGDRLITFPGVGVDGSLRHELVAWSPTSGSGQEDSSNAEALRVVELIRDHVRAHPDETLGVITLGMKHMMRVDALVERACRDEPELADYWRRHTEAGERPFVKNLERVQGDERDAIILSVGYSKDTSGNLPLRFGPILTGDGYRRLNVAVTRARARMTVVSSFDHRDLHPSKCQGRPGLEFLRGFLEFASMGGARQPDAGASGFPINAFEADIQAALEARGLSCVAQYGASSYRIDLVVRHRDQPGRFVLAIECDGASYHSAPTARDRDRLRQEHLEAFGWKFCRIWSTDWFQRREQEIARVLLAYEDAMRSAAEPPAPPRSAPDAPPPPPAPAARGARPAIQAGLAIDDYHPSELVTVARWIASDGVLRTEAEMVSELMRALGFQRRGTKIVERLAAAARGV